MTQIATGFISLLISWIEKFPDLSVDSGVLSQMSNAVDMVLSFIEQVNFIIPLDTILIIIGLVYGIRASKFLVFVINWIIRRIADLIP